MSTKQAYVEIIDFLERNKSKNVNEILETVKQMTESKKHNETVLYDDKGAPFAIFCYYHKQWELLSEVEYGKKKSSKSGFNTMCKIGTNQWTKQQSEAKKAKASMLDEVAKGKIKPQDINSRLEQIEKDRLRIEMKGAPKGTKAQPQLK